MSSTVSFPGLGIGNIELNRVAFTLFGKEIYWYGIIICIGLILALVYGTLKAKKSNVSSDDFLDCAIAAIPTAVVFARLFYVLTNETHEKTFLDVIAVWDGGISIIGSIIGGALAIAIVCLIKKKNILEMYDLVVRCVIIGQIIGRLGNFVNVEVYGVKTTLPWGMYIEELGYAVHPLFLYEMLWNIIGFVILHLLAKNKKFTGEITFTYFAWYGLGRSLLELLRSPEYILNGYISHKLSAAAFVVSTAVLIVLAVRYAKKKQSEAPYEPKFTEKTEECENADAD